MLTFSYWQAAVLMLAFLAAGAYAGKRLTLRAQESELAELDAMNDCYR